jgi:2,3-diaminopropionate biosynthesis protein SbnA
MNQSSMAAERETVADRGLKGILATVGHTPLVQLEKLLPNYSGQIFAKLERFNPGGSIKDRTALNMLIEEIRSGALEAGRSVVVESSSGNLAIGMAQICGYYGIRFVCVVDAKTTEQNLAILKAYQAEIEMVTVGEAGTGEYLPVRLRRVGELVASIPGAYSPNQYVNPLNPGAHEQTMGEISRALDGRVDYLFCATSTFGTLRGCADYIRSHGLNTRIVAVDAIGSVIFGQEPGLRLIPGHGAGVVPPMADPDIPNHVIHVSDLECVVSCRRLVTREAILAGGSSGATVAALERATSWLPEGSTVVMIFPDGGDRYLSTIFSDEWVQKHFGEVSHMWKERPC